MNSPDARLIDYLRLVLTTGVGPLTLRSLLDRFGSPEAVFAASPDELNEVDGALSRRLRSTEFLDEAKRTATDRGIVVILDPRIVNKSYGRIFLESLPNCRVIDCTASGEVQANAAESENLCMRGHSKRENREVFLVFSGKGHR